MPRSDAETQASRHAHCPPGYKPGPLHIALVLTEWLGRITPLALAPAWLALAAIACWPWGGLRIPAAALSLAFTLVDGAGLVLLPRRGRSFGPVTPSLLALAAMHTAVAWGAGLFWANWPGLLLTAVLDTALSGVFMYATWIEPFRIGVTQSELYSPKLESDAPLRLLHITDLHVERTTSREEKLLQLVQLLDPDVTVLTGDYLNLAYVYDAQAQADARELLARLCDVARGPIYAITGSPPVDRTDVIPTIFEDLPITWLLDEIREVNVNGQTIRMIGLRCTRDRGQDAPRLRDLMGDNPAGPFTLLLYHSPDLMPEAVETGIDLYLCGHTHGGQIRLPLVGALITSSAFWKRYEMGRYEEGRTTLYVSRGLGMEGMGAPRARLLAPPEIVLWTLRR
jgi:predicted MPP superfamily phosphohydrolase